MSLYLGLDIGTSGVKAVLCDPSGRIVASAGSEYPLLQPRVGWTEQHPEDWWHACRESIVAALHSAKAEPDRVKGIGLSGQMHGSVLLGADALNGMPDAKPLRPAILWNDQRTASQCAHIEQAVGGRAALVELVGNAALPGFTLPKLLWVRENEPETYAKVRVLMMPKDFIAYRLTGSLSTDVGDASGTLLFDVDHRTWSQRMFGALGVDPSLLPPALESARVMGKLHETAARATGLRAGTPVVAGSGDNMCAAIGAGVVEPGAVLAVLGTSGVIYAHSPKPRKDLPTPEHPNRPAGRVHTMCAGVDRASWCVTGCSLSAGGALKWARDTIAPGVPYDQLMNEAAAIRPGCEGLLFMPHLTGERCPYPDPSARGAWIGLSAKHTRAHLIRAVIEGVTFTMAQILDMMRAIGVPTTTVRLSGGGNRSAFWRQLQADVYRLPVVTTNSDEGGSALGAALLGMVGAGAFPDVPTACASAISTIETRLPDAASSGRFEPIRKVHAALYDDLKDRFGELAGL